MTKEYFYDHFQQDKPTGVGNRISKAFAEKIFKYAGIEVGRSVLETGPGRGVFADACLKAGAEYYAVEPNRQMAESLEQRGAKVICAIVPPLPEMDKQFDVAVMINVMEHMNSMKDALQITQQIREVLKPKGKFVICSPDYLNYRHNFFNCDFSHSYVTTRRRLKQLLISGGFNNIKSCYLSGPISGVAGMFVSAIVSRMPFGFLNGAFPNSKIFHKLYKMQLTLSRKVLILGEKQD
jgi:phospholipid N-methyltransferase